MSKINWMNVGKDHWEGNQERIIEILSKMEWQELEEGMSLPMSPGLGIEFLIKEFKIPRVSHIAISNEMTPFGLYGIYGHYRNADVKLYFVDEGSHISSLCQEVEEFVGID